MTCLVQLLWLQVYQTAHNIIWCWLYLYVHMHACICMYESGGGGGRGHVTYCELHRYDCMTVCTFNISVCIQLCMSVCGDHMTQPPCSNPQECDFIVIRGGTTVWLHSHANSVTHAVQYGLETTVFFYADHNTRAHKLNTHMDMQTCMHTLHSFPVLYSCIDHHK